MTPVFLVGKLLEYNQMEFMIFSEFADNWMTDVFRRKN
jgi:hypothetical protein